MKIYRREVRSFNRGRRGYTLLELLLALGLTIVVISTIATAIQVNLFSLTRAQASIERKQIARSVLAMIANDIRAAVQFRAADYSGLEDVLLSQQLIAGVPLEGELGEDSEGSGTTGGSIADLEALAALGESADSGDLSEVTGSSEFEEAPVEEEEVDDWSVGLVGQSNFIWLDISRLPRIDQYHPLIQTAQDAVVTGSDIKQVAYFVASAANLNESAIFQGDGDDGARGRVGLFRDEIDRAVAFFQGGINPTTPKPYSQLVATEVVEISFRYFDGTNWQTQWDSSENNGFPSAVEINVAVDSQPQAGAVQFNNQADGRLERYRRVVHLPLAEFVEEEDEDE